MYASILVLLTSLVEASPPQVRFSEPKENPYKATEGYSMLEWKPVNEKALAQSNAIEYEVEHHYPEREPGARIIYSGPDHKTLVSGLPEGKHTYHVRATKADDTGQWSKPMILNVNYIDSQKVYQLMAFGAIGVFACLFIIIKGTRDTRNSRRSDQQT